MGYDCMLAAHTRICIHMRTNAGIALHHRVPLRSNAVRVVLFSRLFASSLAPSSPMPLPAKRMHDCFSVNVTISIRGGAMARVKARLGLRLYARRTHSNMDTYAYGCRSHTTPPSTSKVQRRQCSVVLQTLRQLLSSLIANAIACKAHARLLWLWANGQLNTDEQTRTHTNTGTHTHTHTHRHKHKRTR